MPFRQPPNEKNRSARAILKALAEGGTVGILSDHNTIPEESVFVDFFGIPASTTSGLARVALRTGRRRRSRIPLLGPGRRKYRLSFRPAVELARTNNEEADVVENTARFTHVIEDYIRAHPDQWLWMHKRWKTRPPGRKTNLSIVRDALTNRGIRNRRTSHDSNRW